LRHADARYGAQRQRKAQAQRHQWAAALEFGRLRGGASKDGIGRWHVRTPHDCFGPALCETEMLWPYVERRRGICNANQRKKINLNLYFL
jgi:hypothetical protein